MSKEQPLLSNCPLETAEPSRNYARVPGYKKKYKKKTKKKTRKEKKNERRRNQYARIRRYKITSTLGLLIFKLGLLWYKLYDVPIFMILLKK